MASEKQIEANRQNAQKSTGPKTAEGKNKASQNAVTHGLTSHRPVLDNEDTAEFRKYVNELIDQLDPTNPWEFVFAKRASCQAWRIQRAQCYETLALDNLLKSAKDNDKTNLPEGHRVEALAKTDNTCQNKPNSGVCSDPIENRTSSIENHKSLLGQAIVDDFRNHWTLDKLARYESRLENSMIRCLDKFKKVRETQMMNFTSLRHYYRGFTRRPQDFQDDNIAESSCGTAAPGCDQHVQTDLSKLSDRLGSQSEPTRHNENETDKTNPISAFSAQKTPSENEITQNEPNSAPAQAQNVAQSPSAVLPTPDSDASDVFQIENPDAPYVSSIEKRKAALINDDFDSFSKWADLQGHAYGYDDESLEPHCPNPPSTGEYLYVENWQHELLRMVNYPWDKRKNLTKAQLNELVDTILCGMSDPVQFLWDFGLIELTAEAAGKRSLAAQTQEQVPALAC